MTVGYDKNININMHAPLQTIFEQSSIASLMSPSIHTKLMLGYLTTHQRSKRHKDLKARCTENIDKLISARSVPVDRGLHQDLSKIMEENEGKIAKDFPENSFGSSSNKKLKVKNNRQLRWHPMMVKMQHTMLCDHLASSSCHPSAH